MTGNHPLYSVDTIRRIEQAASRALPPFTLMQRAGKAAALLVLELLVGSDAQSVLILAGPGNNGGDALEAAALLSKAGCKVSVLLHADPAQLPADAQRAHERATASNAVFIDPLHADKIRQQSWTVIVDGLLGIGLTRPIAGALRQSIEIVRTLDVSHIVALDVPSGLDADTGTIVGSDAGIAMRATHTITFIGDKPGLHTCDGRDHAGKIVIADLEIPPALLETSSVALNTIAGFSSFLHPRPHNSHKGGYGNVIVLGGASGMSGAAILSARTAAKCGAGRVFVSSIAAEPRLDILHPELMCRAASDMDFRTGVTIAGPGMGTSREACDLLAKALAANIPLVLDADALNLVAEEDALRQKLLTLQTPVLLTPHPLEAARLLGTSTKQIQADRLAAAQALAARFKAHVILKGSGSIIAAPDGRLAINPTGNPALATAGAGDVLSGVCGALLAQGWPAWEAALAATWLHGAAADELVERGIGPIGLVASELIDQIRDVLNRLVRMPTEKHLR